MKAKDLPPPHVDGFYNTKYQHHFSTVVRMKMVAKKKSESETIDRDEFSTRFN